MDENEKQPKTTAEFERRYGNYVHVIQLVPNLFGGAEYVLNWIPRNAYPENVVGGPYATREEALANYPRIAITETKSVTEMTDHEIYREIALRMGAVYVLYWQGDGAGKWMGEREDPPHLPREAAETRLLELRKEQTGG